MLEKGLDFAPIQKTLNEQKLTKDFEEFSRKMRYKWNFKNKPTNNFNETRAFRTKSGWEPPKSDTFLQVFLSLVEKELFSDKMNNSTQKKSFWRKLEDSINFNH